MINAENHQNKTSLRSFNQQNERRLSRMIVGSERALSRNRGFTIKWGVNVT